MSEPAWMKKNCSRSKRRNAVHNVIPYSKEKIAIPNDASVEHIALINYKNWAKSFKKKTAPSPSDWLYSQTKDRNGQTFYEWYRRCKTYKLFPTTNENIIGLICVASFNINIFGYNLFDILSEITSIYYQMNVNIINSLSTTTTDITSRIRENGLKQLLTTDVHKQLSKIINNDNDNNKLYCLMGITMIDLYPRESWNFVFGQASISNRTGIFSFARYCHGFDDIDFLKNKSWIKNKPKQQIEKVKWLKKLLDGDDIDKNIDIINNMGWTKKKQEIFLKRCIKVLVHEIGHLFGIAHCIFFECIMNGSMHLNEADGRPIHFCPICLNKIVFANAKNMNNIDLLKRYKQLNEIYSRFNLFDESNWYKQRIQFIEETITQNYHKYAMLILYLFRNHLKNTTNLIVDNDIISFIYKYSL